MKESHRCRYSERLESRARGGPSGVATEVEPPPGQGVSLTIEGGQNRYQAREKRDTAAAAAAAATMAAVRAGRGGASGGNPGKKRRRRAPHYWAPVPLQGRAQEDGVKDVQAAAAVVERVAPVVASLRSDTSNSELS